MSDRRRAGRIGPGRSLVFALAAALAVPVAESAGAEAGPRSLPRGAAAGASVLLVTLDTTRADHLGAYGGRPSPSPRFDALAREGWLFDDAVTPVPVTLPAHASMMTGLNPTAHGVRHNVEFSLAGGPPTLAELLRSRGYRTAAFVSSFVLDARFGLDRGFEVYDAGVEPPAGTVFPSGVLERPASATAEAALGWLAELPAHAPFFLWVHFYDAHAPYEPPSPYREAFAASAYDGEIAAADAALGRLLDAVRGRPVAVVVAGDHGEGLGDHGERTHGVFLYEESVRVPLVLKLPSGVPAPPRRVATLVSLVDLLPSLTHLLAVEDGGARDGSSWFGGSIGERAGVYLESLVPWLDYGWAPLTAFRTAASKLIRAPRSEYYDLAADPGEKSNRFDDPERRREIATSARELKAFGDPLATLRAAPGAAPIDDEQRSALQALGYLGGAGADPDQAPADPKDRIQIANLLLDAHARMEAGRLEEALALLRSARESSPGDRSVLQSLGKVYLRLGRIREAESALREFTAIRAKADVSLLLAQICVLEGRLDEAGPWLDQAAALEPRHGGVEIARGDLALRRGDAAVARLHYRRAIELDPIRAGGTARSRIERMDAPDPKEVP